MTSLARKIELPRVPGRRHAYRKHAVALDAEFTLHDATAVAMYATAAVGDALGIDELKKFATDVLQPLVKASAFGNDSSPTR